MSATTGDALGLAVAYPPTRMSCARPGIRQASATCYLNAPINAMALSKHGAAAIAQLFHAMPARAQAALLAKDPGKACPVRSDAEIRDHVLALAARLVVGQRVGVGVTETRDVVGRIESARIGRNVGQSGGFEDDAVIAIMRACFPGKHVLMSYDMLRAGARPALHGRRFLVVRGKPYVGCQTVPPTVNRFVLDHGVVTMSIGDEDMGHTIAAFLCGGRAYVYDSNGTRSVELDWTDPAALTRRVQLAYPYDDVTGAYVSYLVYADPVSDDETGGERFDANTRVLPPRVAAHVDAGTFSEGLHSLLHGGHHGLDDLRTVAAANLLQAARERARGGGRKFPELLGLLHTHHARRSLQRNQKPSTSTVSNARWHPPSNNGSPAPSGHTPSGRTPSVARPSVPSSSSPFLHGWPSLPGAHSWQVGGTPSAVGRGMYLTDSATVSGASKTRPRPDENNDEVTSRYRPAQKAARRS